MQCGDNEGAQRDLVCRPRTGLKRHYRVVNARVRGIEESVVSDVVLVGYERAKLRVKGWVQIDDEKRISARGRPLADHLIENFLNFEIRDCPVTFDVELLDGPGRGVNRDAGRQNLFQLRIVLNVQKQIS